MVKRPSVRAAALANTSAAPSASRVASASGIGEPRQTESAYDGLPGPAKMKLAVRKRDRAPASAPAVRWPTLKAPTLLLLADSGDAKRTDAKRRAETEALAKAAKVQSVWFSPGHHDLHLEFPERVADILDTAARDGFFA